MQVYEYYSTDKAMKLYGKRPLRLKWIDTDKGGANIRSRLVCTEVRRPGTDAVFAPTPPLDAMRALIARAAERYTSDGRPLTLQLVDISRAHFYAPSVRDVFVQLPQGDPMHGKPNVCAKLRRTMYGTLDAAEQWARHYTSVLLKVGFVQGTSSPCHFHHPDRQIWVLVHGDDFFSCAPEQIPEVVP